MSRDWSETMPSSFIKNYLQDLHTLSESISGEEFDTFITALTQAYQRETNIFVFGNGGCAVASSHFACDINKGVSYGKEKRFKIICLNDNIPIMMAYANDISYEDVFVEQLKNFLQPEDLVVGLSGSGNSMNVVKALQYANEHGAQTFALCGYGGGRLKEAAQQSLHVKSYDMQKVEDMYTIILHCVMQWFDAKLKH